MQFDPVEPPRIFFVGKSNEIPLFHVGDCKLANDEVLTLLGPNGEEYDLVAKDWGFYATPSVNRRLISFGIMTSLVEGLQGKRFIHLVYEDKRDQYENYCKSEGLRVIAWLHEGS